MLGLPECAVGLLPGAGGTQRLPRLVGIDLGLQVLLQGRNLAGQQALGAGLVDAVVEEGDEVPAAEAWLLSDAADATQPWDRPGSVPLAHREYSATIKAHRIRELARMLGEKWEVRNFGVGGRTMLKKGDFPFSQFLFCKTDNHCAKSDKWLALLRSCEVSNPRPQNLSNNLHTKAQSFLHLNQAGRFFLSYLRPNRKKWFYNFRRQNG